MPDWNWNGARWWKIDFHTHTPASDDYGKGPDQERFRQITPAQWLLDYMRANIDCVAVTDHNSGAWVDKLKTALEEMRRDNTPGYRDFFLFPGVEISVHGGIHLLAVLDSSATTSDVDTLLGAVGFQGAKGRSDSVTTKSFSEVVGAIHDAGGIAIPAHVDKNNGLLATLDGTTLQQAIDCTRVFAMELLDSSWTKPAAYTDRRRSWTEVLGSDTHHPSESAGSRSPGSHFTWVKMTHPCLEGLRLALLDGALSVQRSDSTPDDPNAHAALVIESVEVHQARYMGRSKRFSANLNPWLNSVIGGRGAGKSTLVEFLRATLGRGPELPDSLKPDFEKYRHAYQNRNDDGLLTAESQFSVIYRKDGVRYRVQWDHAHTLNPIEVEDGVDGWKAEKGEVVQRFPVRIYSQKQIFELAKDPLALMRIVDEAPLVDRASWDEAWRKEESRFLLLRAKGRDLQAGLIDEARVLGDLEDIKRKLEVFEGTDHASVLKDYQRRSRQLGILQNWETGWSSTGDRLRTAAEKLLPASLDSPAFSETDEADRALLTRASQAIEDLRGIAQEMEFLAAKCDEAFRQWTVDRDATAWKIAVDGSVAAYEELCQKLEHEGAGDPSAYRDLVNRRQEIEARLVDFQKRREDLKANQEETTASRAALVALRQELTRRREKFIADVLAGNVYVRIKVRAYGARDTVESEFRKLIQRETGGFEKDIGTVDGGDGLLSKLYAGNPDASEIEIRLGHIKDGLHNIAAGQSPATDMRDQRFGSHLSRLKPEVFDHLDAWFPEDTLQVEYSTGGDGTSFRSIQEGSPGQKTAALLAFLLSYGEEPIVLDQPEDDLDNQLIYSLIVKQLRMIKRKRQVIVVSHNANIVVNGDAELVLALAARGGETHIEAGGSLQEKVVRDTICTIMEGGREAFEQRYRRISL